MRFVSFRCWGALSPAALADVVEEKEGAVATSGAGTEAASQLPQIVNQALQEVPDDVSSSRTDDRPGRSVDRILWRF